MSKARQIDSVSKKLVKLSKRMKKFEKNIHYRSLRKFAKNINNPNPQYNRYHGYIG